jgi:hypothetical protein
MSSLLSTHLLHSSLHSFTNELLHAALRRPGEEQVAARAAAASEFFVAVLNRSIPSERQALELYETCLKALRQGTFSP